MEIKKKKNVLMTSRDPCAVPLRPPGSPHFGETLIYVNSSKELGYANICGQI